MARTYLSLDVETTGLNPYRGDRIVGWGTIDGQLNRKYRWKSDQTLRILRAQLQASDIVICHNAKFEMKMLQKDGIRFPRLPHDTMLMYRLLNSHELTLKLDALAAKYLKKLDNQKDAIKQWQKLTGLPMYKYPKLAEYCLEDCEDTIKLFFRGKEQLKHEGLAPIYKTERQLIPIVCAMENRGIRVDLNYCEQASTQCTTDLKSIERDIYRIAKRSFNINSPKQLADVMFNNLGFKCLEYKVTMNPDLSSGTLARYGTTFTKRVIAWRHRKKQRDTYFQKFLNDSVRGTLHPNFFQAGAKTGRFTSDHQQIPRDPAVRRAIIPRKGKVFLFCDYAQVEMRIFAHYAQDEGMLQVIRNGGDLHEGTAKVVTGKSRISPGLRQIFKGVNFGIIYGMAEDKFASYLGISIIKAKTHLAQYHSRFPGVRRLMAQTRRDLLARGFLVDPFGRRYRIPERFAYKGVNALVQGGAASLLKNAMVRVNEILKPGTSDMVLTIHDELCIECDRGAVKRLVPKLRHAMADFTEFGNQPLDVAIVECREHWGEVKLGSAINY